MQPCQASPDLVAGTWMENVGEARWDRAWRFKSMIESGARVTFSSDWQVGEMDPHVGIYSAMTRARLDGSDTWTVGERHDLEQHVDLTVVGGRAIHDVRGEMGGVAAAARLQDPAGSGQACGGHADAHLHAH